MSKYFSKDELVILHTENMGRHSIEIVKIANKDVSANDETALIHFGAFATKVNKENLYKLPSGIKKAIQG